MVPYFYLWDNTRPLPLTSKITGKNEGDTDDCYYMDSFIALLSTYNLIQSSALYVV